MDKEKQDKLDKIIKLLEEIKAKQPTPHYYYPPVYYPPIYPPYQPYIEPYEPNTSGGT